MNFAKLIIVPALATQLTSCYPDGSFNGGCENGTYLCTGEDLGKMALDTATDDWFIDIATGQQKQVSNSNRYAGTTNVLRQNGWGLSIPVSSHSETPLTDPCSTYPCTDYATPGYEEVALLHPANEVSIRYRRMKNISPYEYKRKVSREALMSRSEKLEFTFGNATAWSCELDNSSQSTFHPSFQYMGNTFQDVYILRSNLSVATTTYFCDSIIFKKRKGVVGFVMSDGVRWLIE